MGNIVSKLDASWEVGGGMGPEKEPEDDIPIHTQWLYPPEGQHLQSTKNTAFTYEETTLQ